jgi:polyhydroxybutyrate depolymerase
MRAWSRADDQAIVEVVRQFQQVFTVDRKRVHVTGFSRGGFVTWRLVCDHADLFASAAPAGASDGSDRGEITCFSSGRVPARKVPLLLLIGRTDEAVGYRLMIAIRDAALSHYQATSATLLARTPAFMHTRWSSPDGAVVEAFEHSYETAPTGPWGWARGHCFPGSTVDPRAQYAVACSPPNAFAWGEEVVRFFNANPKS